VMPKRFAFFCAIPLFLSTSAFAQSQNVTATATETTLWDHNGSVMYLITNGLSWEFFYKKPRPGMLEVGAHPDSLLFKGQINDGQFSGTAYLFNAHCGQVPFEVKGPILDDNARVVLTGQAPRVGRNCQPYGNYTSTLEFRLLKTTEVAEPPQPSKTAQAPDVEEPKPQVPSSAVGEPRLPSTPSEQTSPTAQTPRIEELKPELHEVGEPKKATTPSDQPSLTTSAPVAAQGFVDKNVLAPSIIAMNVALPLLSVLFLIRMLR
jgi:hypothetical protein